MYNDNNYKETHYPDPFNYDKEESDKTRSSDSDKYKIPEPGCRSPVCERTPREHHVEKDFPEFNVKTIGEYKVKRGVFGKSAIYNSEQPCKECNKECYECIQEVQNRFPNYLQNFNCSPNSGNIPVNNPPNTPNVAYPPHNRFVRNPAIMRSRAPKSIVYKPNTHQRFKMLFNRIYRKITNKYK